MSDWKPPHLSEHIRQNENNTCFTCGRYVAPNEGAIEHEFDSVVCPNCIKHTTRGDYRKETGTNPDGSMKFRWAHGGSGKGKKRTFDIQSERDAETYHIGGDLRNMGY